jgi:hypothetical protein
MTGSIRISRWDGIEDANYKLLEPGIAAQVSKERARLDQGHQPIVLVNCLVKQFKSSVLIAETGVNYRKVECGKRLFLSQSIQFPKCLSGLLRFSDNSICIPQECNLAGICRADGSRLEELSDCFLSIPMAR